MTREDLKRQVFARVGIRPEDAAGPTEALDEWLKFYPVSFKFGPAAVMAGERLLRRVMNQAERVARNRRTEEEAKKGHDD